MREGLSLYPLSLGCVPCRTRVCIFRKFANVHGRSIVHVWHTRMFPRRFGHSGDLVTPIPIRSHATHRHAGEPACVSSHEVFNRKNTATIECASSWRNAEGVIVQDYALNTRSEIEGGHGKKAHDQESIDDVRLELRAIDDQLRHHVHLAKKEADASLKDIGLAPELTHPVEKATAAVANTRTSGSILLQVPGDDGGNNMPRQYGVDIGTKGQQHSRRTDKLQPCMR
jgi:hypothetical protein